MHCLMGDRVIVHPGVRIGQDGFGYLMSGAGHLKVPQVGRVIVQDDVEIGAATTIDRGANRDTVIGEGTKIDNLVQVGHNVVIGRHCIIIAQTGISGSVTIRDFVVLGARVGVNNHVTIGEGAQIAATSIVNDDVPPGARWGGIPAKPARLWFREMKLLERLASREKMQEKLVRGNEMTSNPVHALDTRQILEILPHRYPFLMIDRVEQIRGDKSCIGIKNVTVNEPFFQGHFPGRPVMPGVLLIEGMAQSAGAICALALGTARPLQLGVFHHRGQGQVPAAGRARRSGRVPHAALGQAENDVVVSWRGQGRRRDRL